MQYLNEQDIEIIHSVVSQTAEEGGDEPLPPFSYADTAALHALINLPKRSFFGFEQYASLAEKAAIIFYTANKRHIFLNGNKRMSIACLIVFLAINGKELTVGDDELTQKALKVAESYGYSFQEIKDELVKWIESNLTDTEMELTRFNK